MASKIAIYLRYSTKNQSEDSIDIQRAAILEYCITNDYTVVSEFVDRARSGATDERPGFQGMMAEAKRNPCWEVILVFDYSRFSRSYEDTLKYISELRELGIAVISVKENFEEYLKTVFLKNEEFVEKVVSATRSGLALRASEGKHCGGKPPYGFDVDSDGKLTVNNSEAEVVKLIFDLFTRRISYREIEDHLRREGVNTRTGKPFSRRCFKEILSREKYTGEFPVSSNAPMGAMTDGNTYGVNSQVKNTVKIIDDETFKKAQVLLSRRANGKAISSEKSRTLLSGTDRIVCGCCGEPLSVRQRAYKGKIYLVYFCPGHRNKGCPTKEVRANDADAFVIECICKTVSEINIELLRKTEVVDSNMPEQYESKIREHLMDPRRPYVCSILEALDARVVVNNEKIEIEKK